ncbi:MAG: Zinc transporter, periplasmic-binding protein ZnuA [Labilithrix sp.]|nr:Zinc transporter, periplasmic-binding protein ZnuA [Labilithrix sp.]
MLGVLRSATVLALGVVFAAFSALGCKGSGGGGAAPERLAITTSIFPVHDLVRRVAGADADVTLVVPPGVSEHGYVPTAEVTAAAARSRVFVMVGLGLDPWMETLASGAGPKARVVKVGDRVPAIALKDAAGVETEESDPHFWLDPERTRLVVRTIAEELGKLDAKHAIAYRTRATEIDASLAALDKELRGRAQALGSRTVVTFHPGFAYFAEHYQLEVVGVVEPAAGTAPGPAEIAKVRAVLAPRKVPALYREPQLDPAPVQALADAAKLPLGVLDPLGGGAGTDSYEKLLRADMAALEQHQK